MAGLLDYASSVVENVKNSVQGLLNDPRTTLDDIVNTLAAKAAAQQAATKAAWATRDPKIMAQNALDSSQTALGFAPLGITAWHGSPHKFNKFSMDKIGTGEGAQAYGHGLYMAENANVAKQYQDALKNRWASVTSNGLPVSHPKFDEAMELLSMNNKPITNASVKQQLEKLKRGYGLRRSEAAKAGLDKFSDDIASVDEALSLIPSSRFDQNGALYKVDIPDEAVARMLDWDKPLSQQAPEVLEALKKTSAKYGPVRGNASIYSDAAAPYMTGHDFYRDLANALSDGGVRRGSTALTGQDLAATKHLQELGIPGIRYLDGGSRGAGTGTSNFVVFDPELIRILERNGQATGAVPWQPGEWRGLLGNN